MFRFAKIKEVVRINNREEIVVNGESYFLRSASLSETELFYALPQERDEALACIGHVRLDFGRSGREFWHSWWPRGDEALNSPEFKSELAQVMDELRKNVLKDLRGMEDHCREHGGEISGGSRQNYGYVLDTPHYRYCLRCNPQPGDYQAYLTCFDLDQQRLNLMQAVQPGIVGMVFFGNGDAMTFTDAESYIAEIREELPYHPTTGFRWKTVTDDPAVRKTVDDILYDFYGEENPRQLEDYEPQPGQGLTMGGM